MEIRNRIKRNVMLWIIPLSVILLMCACRNNDRESISFPAVFASQHTLMTLTPKFSIQAIGATLHKEYLRLSTGKYFPMVGILRVDGKAYRFMGGDSLRISPLASISTLSYKWGAKYSYLYPSANWEQPEYDDSHWQDGTGSFGSEDYLYPTHTLWGANSIYVRRHITIDNKEVLNGHKLYIQYIADDQIKLYCNGELAFYDDDYHFQKKCRQLSDSVVEKLHTGDNIIAAYGHDASGEFALMDYGLYVENKTYREADTATLLRMDIQATQTHYVFQCGNVELRVDFVSPALLEGAETAGCPIGFISYQVFSKTDEEMDIEVIFDMDREWMDDNRLLLNMATKETKDSCENGHVIYSQKLSGGKENCGALLLGYEEQETFLYEGDNTFSCWNRKGKRQIKNVMKITGDSYQSLKKKCDESDVQWYMKAIQTGGENYAARMLPTYRDFVAKHRFVMTVDDQFFCIGDTLGNVRKSYECFPYLLFFDRTDWMKGLLNPIFETCECTDWVKKYPPCDIGFYPIANRQISVEDHSLEVTADMLMMTLTIVETEEKFDYAEEHWHLLCRWADYLKEGMETEQTFNSESLNEKDGRAKRTQGWMAYQKLLQLRQEYE